MNGHDELQVEIWDPAKASNERIVLGERRHLPARAWGLVGTVFVHLVLMPLALVNTGIVARATPDLPQGAPQLDSKSQDLVLIDMTVISEKAPRQGQIPDLGVTAARSLKSAASKVVLYRPTLDIPHDRPDGELPRGAIATESAAESSARARLVGIYTGQIRARIERVWRRPRTPVDEDGESSDKRMANAPFECLVTIVQDATGRVQETELLRCNGSPTWQRSLVVAINQASPLPAPPDPTVFARTVTLNFIGFAFAPGMSADEYEIRSPTARAAADITAGRN
jgi:hypothetical protein